MQNQIKELNHKNIGNCLKKTVEVHEHVLLSTFEQYNQIFHQTDKASSNKMDKFGLDFTDSSLLFSWMMLKLNNLVNEIRLGLSNMLNKDPQFFNQLLSLKQLCNRFSSFLLKIGLDFKNHFNQLFNEYLEHDLKINLHKLIKRFEASLDSYNIISSHIDLNGNDREVVDNQKSSDLKELNPPKCILQFAPLKQLCNDLIKNFQKLVSFAATSDLIFKFKLVLEDHLKESSNIVEKYIRSEKSSLKENEQVLLINFRDVFRSSLIAHIQLCYKSLIESFKSIDTLGIPSIEFSKIEVDDYSINYNDLDLNNIFGPL